MAATDKILYHATDALILPSPRKYYRSYIHAHHWQLRSLISSPFPNLIYYPSGTDVYQLNTKTHEREIVTSLPFSPRCLTASNGWIVGGGDGGDYAAIKVDGRDWQPRSSTIGPDARLDFDPMRRPYLNQQTEAASSGRSRNTRPAQMKITKIGTEIVNCITVWCPGRDRAEQAYDKPVAILSNNDHTVTVANLADSEVLDTLQLDDCINRAVISPNGRLLIAIGDDLYLHVYVREQKVAESRSIFATRDKPEYEWVRCPRIQLVGQGRADDACDQKGSFAATFSPSGRYLAVGTQYGVISIFQTCFLTNPDENPLIMTFTSAGSPTSHGAIRAMEFSPAPFDLLAWTEHNGKVGIADIRRDFISRQIIDIDMRAEGMEKVTVIERPSDLAIDPRLRSFRTNTESGRPDAVATELDRQQLRHLTREVLDRNQAPLSSEETEVLEALQVHRRQRERDAAREALDNITIRHPISWTDLADDLRRNAAGERQSTASALPSSLREFVNGRSNDSLRAYITDRNQERERRGQQPRRRGSVILAAAQTALDRDSSEPRAQSSDQSRGTLTNGRIGQDPPRLPAIGSDAPSNPWAEIEALYNIAVDLPVDPTARMRIETDADPQRDYIRSVQRHWQEAPEDRSSLRIGDRFFLRGSPPVPSETTGCAWSNDGRILYVGAENGVFEYHVNSTGRRTFPSITMR
ncbi:MAG: hypothetical protein M1818_000887 [Claussenomyces sp. TS43310]|nr:MAG: hypothetical protein M1818_000887 [Claussenomyces sp. TS43310]